jgi:hypothetical protein
MKYLGLFLAFHMNLHTQSRRRSQSKKRRLRLQQKVAAPPAPQHWFKQ